MSKDRVEILEITPIKRKPQSTGRGAGIWFSLSGFILFWFDWRCGLEGQLMWGFRVAGLILLLIGALGLGVSFDKQKES